MLINIQFLFQKIMPLNTIKDKMFSIANTDIEWFEFLKKNNIFNNVNFWTPTPWNVKKLKQGDLFYFMLKSPIRKLGQLSLEQLLKIERSF